MSTKSIALESYEKAELGLKNELDHRKALNVAAFCSLGIGALSFAILSVATKSSIPDIRILGMAYGALAGSILVQGFVIARNEFRKNRIFGNAKSMQENYDAMPLEDKQILKAELEAINDPVKQKNNIVNYISDLRARFLNKQNDNGLNNRPGM